MGGIMSNPIIVDTEGPGIRTVDGGDQSVLVVQTGATTVNVKGGSGFIIDRSNIINGRAQSKFIRWADKINLDLTPLLPDTDGNFPTAIDQNGDVVMLEGGNNVSLLTPEQFNVHIQIATITVSGGNIQSVNLGAYPNYGLGNSFYPLIRAMGKINSRANPLSIEPSQTNGTTLLQLQSNPGEHFSALSGYVFDVNLPHFVLQTEVVDPLVLIHLKRDSTFSFSATSEVDPEQYEDPIGTLNAVGVNKWTLQRIFLFSQREFSIVAPIYGDAEFATKTAAIASSVFPAPSLPITTTAFHVADLAIRQGAKDFSDPNEFEFLDV